MSVPGIEAIEASPAPGHRLHAVRRPDRPRLLGDRRVRLLRGRRPDFGNLVLEGLDKLDGVQRNADSLAVQAATGKLESLDYTIAATQAQVTTQVTVAVRNKAIEAFTEIMRMQVEMKETITARSTATAAPSSTSPPARRSSRCSAPWPCCSAAS